MRYRRLGRTELMVSEVGVDADALRGLDHDTAVETLRAAFIAGVTVVTWHVSDSLDDVEPLIVEAAKIDRGRLTLVAILDALPSPEALGPQVEAIAGRLGSPVDVVAFPDAPTAAHAAAIEEVRSRSTRFVAYAGDTPLSPAQAATVDVIVTAAAPRHLAGLGVIVLAEARAEGADSTAIPARSAESVRAAIAVAALT